MQVRVYGLGLIEYKVSSRTLYDLNKWSSLGAGSGLVSNFQYVFFRTTALKMIMCLAFVCDSSERRLCFSDYL